MPNMMLYIGRSQIRGQHQGCILFLLSQLYKLKGNGLWTKVLLYMLQKEYETGLCKHKSHSSTSLAVSIYALTNNGLIIDRGHYRHNIYSSWEEVHFDVVGVFKIQFIAKNTNRMSLIYEVHPQGRHFMDFFISQWSESRGEKIRVVSR